MANAELTCQELVELVTDYLENRRALPERLRFEEHLALCVTAFDKLTDKTIQWILSHEQP